MRFDPKTFAVAAMVALASGRFARAADAPPGYTLIKSTDAGRAMIVRKAQPKTVRDAIDAVLNDLDDYFDDDYDVYGAAENAADSKSGFATIRAKYHGHAVRGLVTARLTAQGAVGVVIFCQADAPAAAWRELIGPPAAAPARVSDNPLDTATPPAAASSENPLDTAAPSTAAPAAAAPQAAPPVSATPAPPQPVRLTEYRFPDNTGSVGLADGWRPSPQQGSGIILKGPAGQEITMGATAAVNTPNSTAVQLARQYPVPNSVLLVAPYDDPAAAIVHLMPQFSRYGQRNGGAAVEADHVRLVQKLPPTTAGSRWGVVAYGLTKTTNGQSVHVQVMAQVGMVPLTNESYMIWITGCSAPDATAAVDGPVMQQMIASWRTNDAQIQQNTQTWIAGRQQWFAAEQAGHQAQVAAGDAQVRQYEIDQNRQSRALDDGSEVTRGVRDIEDTRTGELTPANLGNIDEIIAGLNAQEPGRYKPLALKDKLDPVPGGR